LWKGKNVWFISLLNSVGWRKAFDSIVKKMIGLDKVKGRKPIFDGVRTFVGYGEGEDQLRLIDWDRRIDVCIHAFRGA
jgi:hypothetical protein